MPASEHFAAFAEYQHQTLSRRFGLPPELIYLTCAIQFVCAFGVLTRSWAPWAAAGLTVTTLGAPLDARGLGRSK